MAETKTEKIEGIVQSKAEKKIKVNNFIIFFNFNSDLIKDINVGDNVAVGYQDTISKKDNKLYHNGKSITKIEPKINPEESVKWVNIQKYDTSTVNTILMVARDLYKIQSDIEIELVRINKRDPTELTNVNYDEIVKDVLEGLKLI